MRVLELLENKGIKDIMFAENRNKSNGFTLVELLAVVAVITILLGIMLPALSKARTRARVTKVHGELKNLTAGLEMYFNTFEKYPPARDGCCGYSGSTKDHHEFSVEVLEQHYVDIVPKDIFNDGPKYKYVKPGPGWVNGGPGTVVMWVPRNYPDYQGENRDKDTDIMYPRPNGNKSPIDWAIWSVGPYGPLEFWASGEEHVPAPKRSWYNPGSDKGPKETKDGVKYGVITHLSNGRISP